MRTTVSWACAAIMTMITVFMSACGGGSGSGGSVSPPPPPASPPPPPFGANFSEIQDSVFTPTCAVSGCHTGAGAPQGLRLDESSSYALLVGVESAQNGSFLRVEPGNPNDSWLIMKLEGTASVGMQMPLGGTPLSQATIDVIRQWITEGAIDDRAPSADPVTVTDMTPVPFTEVEPPNQIVAVFDRELDVSTVNALTFLFDRAGGDNTFEDGNEQQISGAGRITTNASGTSATFDLTGLDLPDDTYRVRLLGEGASVIMDVDANVLDGEFDGSFPSGDGVQGGDFEAAFTVTAPPSGFAFAEVQAVFNSNCTSGGCHSGDTPAAGLNLEAGNSFANIVNVPSIQVPALDRVEPNDPDNSYLIQKLAGTAAVGLQMPFLGTPLPQATIDDIKEWIANGAIP